MASAAALALVLAGSGALVQADLGRTTLVALRRSAAARRTTKAAGYGLLALALALACQPQGAERGVPVFLGLLAASMVAALLVHALAPRWHAPLAGGAAGLGTVLAIGALA